MNYSVVYSWPDDRDVKSIGDANTMAVKHAKTDRAARPAARKIFCSIVAETTIALCSALGLGSATRYFASELSGKSMEKEGMSLRLHRGTARVHLVLQRRTELGAT